MKDVFLVLTPGPYTTVQDKGRVGFQNMGIPRSGALDVFSYRIANRLVGNPEDSAALEITVMGPQLAIMNEADVALTGAEMEMKLNHKPVETWKSTRVEPGDVLSIQAVKSGCRGYLAVTGGIVVPMVMGSCSTYVGGKIGGYKGRPLRKGDVIQNGYGNLIDSPRCLPESWIPRYSAPIIVRAIPGPQDDYFEEGLYTLFGSEYLITDKADRMGCRLQGPEIKKRVEVPKSIISEPTMPGGIQVPTDNQPIILLAEQTVGGYTKIATAISTDLSRIAQAIPGDTIQFERITLEVAHRIYEDREAYIKEIVRVIANQ